MTRRSPNSRPHSHAVASAPGVIRASVIWGIVIGILQCATPLAFWWLDDATVYALGLAVIAAIYIGFAVADGRPKVIAVETGVASEKANSGLWQLAQATGLSAERRVS